MRQPVSKRLAVAVIALSGAALLAPLWLLADSPTEWKAPSRASRRKNPIPADAKSIAAGKVVYAGQCLSCHGLEGKGDGPAARGINPKPRNLSDPAIQEQTDGSMFWKIAEGKAPMPTFEKLLKPEQRWKVINYVRTFAHKGGK